MLSTRTSFDLTVNALAAARAAVADDEVLDLTESNPTRAGIPYDGDAIRAALATPASLLYEPLPFGLPSARAAVAKELEAHGVAVGAEHVVLVASTSEAYAFLFKLLCDPGDEVLVPRPSYPLFEHLARLESVRAVPYRLLYDGGWYVDLDSVRAGRTVRTRAVVLVSPNNPTGSFVKQNELEAITSLGLPLLSDEVFARYALAREAPAGPSALHVAPSAPLVFSLGGLSKLAGLPQMKLAWIAAGGEPRRVAGALARLEVVADAYLSVGTPVQQALPSLLASRALAERAILARTRANHDALRAAVSGSAVSVLAVEGGWYATLRLPRTRPEEAWALTLLEEDRVYVHPGHFFDFEDEAYAVVSLLTREPTFREGVSRIVRRVDRDA